MQMKQIEASQSGIHIAENNLMKRMRKPRIKPLSGPESFLMKLVLLVLLTAGFPAFANAIPSIFATCEATLLSIVNPIKQSPLEFPADLREELKLAQETFLKRKQTVTKMNSGEPIPKYLAFNDLTYKVVAFLGAGGEGTVFLVEREARRFIFKRFYSKSSMNGNLNFGKILQLRGFDVVQPVTVEKESNTVLYPYVNGINVDEILRPYPAPLVSERTTELVRIAFERYQSDHATFKRFHPHGLDILHRNVLLDLESFKFVVFDPK